MTCQPSDASCVAIAAPIRLAAPVINSFLETIPIYYPKYKTNKPYHKSDENQLLSNLALQPWRYNMRVNRCLLANF